MRLIGVKSHRFELVVMLSIAVGEGDAAILHAENAIIRDGHAMSVAAEVIQNFARGRERLLGGDHPFLLAEGTEPSGESLGVSQSSNASRELKLVFVERLPEQIEDFAAEDQTKSFDGEEKAFAGWYESARGHRRVRLPGSDSADGNGRARFGPRCAVPQGGIKPSVPPKCVRPNSSNVWETALNKMSKNTLLLVKPSGFNSCGRVKTRWK